MLIIFVILFILFVLAVQSITLKITGNVLKIKSITWKRAIIVGLISIVLTPFSYLHAVGAVIVLLLFIAALKSILKLSWKQVIAVSIVQFIVAIGFALLTIVPFRYFVASPFVVAGNSMAPTLEQDDYLLIKKFGSDYERGDLVIFESPSAELSFIANRIIGLPGETIEIIDGEIYLGVGEEFELFDEDYTESYTHGKTLLTLGKGEYFMMGDNREESLDSRRFGPVSRHFIVGEVWLKLR